jgi:small subunit ribosomal protein S6
MFILDSGRYGRDPNAVSGQISKIVEEAGGEILVTRLWEERRLAYTIKGQRKGTYWLTYFRLAPESLSAVRQQFRLSDSILRMLLLKVDPKIVDTLVAHALAGPAAIGAQRRAAEAAAAARLGELAPQVEGHAQDRPEEAPLPPVGGTPAAPPNRAP